MASTNSLTTFASVLATALLVATPALAQHACDPVAEPGWRVLASTEIANTVDSAPYAAGTPGDWFVDRTTTLLPLCNYFTPVGSYSLRSYSLDPTQKTEHVAICRAGAQGTSVAIPPYAGPCPPRDRNSTLPGR
jgi:hypothetical protein